MSKASEEYRYEKLTWPEINDAVELGKVCILPCGAVEQHGPHLPLDVDLVCPTEIAHGAGREVPTSSWCCRPSPTATPATSWTFRDDQQRLRALHAPRARHHQVARLPRLQEDHPAQRPRLELPTSTWWPGGQTSDRRGVPAAWWNLLTVDKEFLPSWRESTFPGGCAHACELETSLYMYLDGDNVRTDKIESGRSPSMRRTAPSTGSTASRRVRRPYSPGQQLQRDRRARRGRARDSREGPSGVEEP